MRRSTGHRKWRSKTQSRKTIYTGKTERLDTAEEMTSKIESKVIEIIQAESQRRPISNV